MPGCAFEGGSIQFFFGQPQQLLFGSSPLGHQFGNVRLIVLVTVKCDRESFDRRLLQCRCQAQDRATIDTTGKVAADRYIGFQACRHRVDQTILNTLNVLGRIGMGVVRGGKLQIPPAPRPRLQMAVTQFRDQQMTGLERLDALKCRRSGHHHLHHLMQRRSGAQSRLNVGVLQDRFDFRSPHDSAVIDGVVQRFDAKPVADQHETLLAVIVNHDRELATKFFDKSQAVANVQRQRDRAVTLAAA